MTTQTTNNPIRPEAVQEAMAHVEAHKHIGPMIRYTATESRDHNDMDVLAAYVRELEAERDRLRERNAELEDLFDLQHARTVEAVGLWREAHPGNDLVMPDLGELLAWFWTERDRLQAELEKAGRG